MQKLVHSMSLFTCYVRLLPNVVLYRSGGGELIPWCPEVVLYLIQPGECYLAPTWPRRPYNHLTYLPIVEPPELGSHFGSHASLLGSRPWPCAQPLLPAPQTMPNLGHSPLSNQYLILVWRAPKNRMKCRHAT